MINPGGSPGTSFSKSAQTRFNNNQINAARATMPFNQAAQQSLRNMKSTGNPGGPPVGPSLDVPNPVTTDLSQGPLPELGPPPSPEDQVKSYVNELVGAKKLDSFLNSARVKDAAEAVRLKNIFNSTNPNKTPDNRNLITQVISRLNTRGSGGF